MGKGECADKVILAFRKKYKEEQSRHGTIGKEVSIGANNVSVYRAFLFEGKCSILLPEGMKDMENLERMVKYRGKNRPPIIKTEDSGDATITFSMLPKEEKDSLDVWEKLGNIREDMRHIWKQNVFYDMGRVLAGELQVAWMDCRAFCLDGSLYCLLFLFAAGDRAKLQGVMLQYGETDWEFLKRVAQKAGLYLVPNASVKGVRYMMGLPAGTQRIMPEGKIKIKFDRKEYMQKSRNGMKALRAADMQELTVCSREIWRIGDWVSYQGREYFAWKMVTEYGQAECIHTYYLRTKEAIRTMPISYRGMAGCSFMATVTDVKRDKVQIEVEQDEWGAADGKKWFLFSTVYSSGDGTGWYCMPEIGDSVRLYVPEKEEDAFVISAVHKETDSARQNPDCKSWKTKYGKEILFTPNSILLTNNQGMMVEMDDEQGITIASDRNITIEAEENLTVSSANASLLVAAEKVLQVKQGGTAMTLEKDIVFTGGEFRIQ